MGCFTKNDQRINRKGRLPASTHIAATFADLVIDFPDPAPSERKLLHVAATLLFRGESCKDNAVAHRCIGEARKIIAGLRSRRAAAAKPVPKSRASIAPYLRDELAAELERDR
jgi:hypothetical protein